jgi:O-acetyl-ADP-ribose deacetylase (regulator of RNase III)
VASLEVLDTDITTLAVDAIANAANAQLLHGGGVAGAIARAAGPELERESRAAAPIALGDAVSTTAGDLPSRWVIHAATMLQPGGTTTAGVVRRCTAATLWKAEELGARSLALVAVRHRRRRLPARRGRRDRGRRGPLAPRRDVAPGAGRLRGPRPGGGHRLRASARRLA